MKVEARCDAWLIPSGSGDDSSGTPRRRLRDRDRLAGVVLLLGVRDELFDPGDLPLGVCNLLSSLPSFDSEPADGVVAAPLPPAFCTKLTPRVGREAEAGGLFISPLVALGVRLSAGEDGTLTMGDVGPGEVADAAPCSPPLRAEAAGCCLAGVARKEGEETGVRPADGAAEPLPLGVAETGDVAPSAPASAMG